MLIVSLIAGGAIALLAGNKRGDEWEEKVRSTLYALTGDSIPDYDVDHPDSLGIPFTWYPTQNGITPGNQYNATIVCNYALLYLDTMQQQPHAGAQARFTHCVQWLQQHMERHAGYALFRFSWQQPWYDSVKAPFTSGMTSGLAMQVFRKAYPFLKDSSLLRDASLLLNGFAVPVDSGGFTYKEPRGWWYEELADTAAHTPRILDGHLFALLGLYDYYQADGDPPALEYFNRGAAALQQVLPAYDAGNGAICYDKYCKPADKKYRQIITGQLEQLMKVSPAPVYQHYLRKWRQPLERPYAWRVLRDGNRSGMLLLAGLWMLCFAGCWLVLRLLQKAFGKMHHAAG